MDAPDEPLVFDGELRREHFAEFSAATQKRLGRGGAINLIAVAYLTAVFILTIALLRLADHVAIPIDPEQWLGPGEVALLAFMAGVLLTFAFVAAWARMAQTNWAARILREGGSYLGARRFTLDSTGITSQGGYGRSTTNWSAVLEMTEGRSVLLLWTDPGAAVIVPIDGIDPDRLPTLKSVIAARIATLA